MEAFCRRGLSFSDKIRGFGLVYFISQIAQISGRVLFCGKKVVAIRPNPIYPVANSVAACLYTLLLPIKIPIYLHQILST